MQYSAIKINIVLLAPIGLFDGFKGYEVSDFAIKRMPAELLLGQLSQNSSDDAVRDVLRQAFVNVDREYFESNMESITSRIVLKQDPNVAQNDPHLKKLDNQAQIGCSATVVLILNRKMFVANVGDTRAVLCSQTPNGEMKVTRLTVDHVLGNEDEELRLSQLGLSPREAEEALSTNGYTRCLGYHDAKGGYSEVEALIGAKDEPVLCEPEIHGAVPLEQPFQFLLVFSRSLADCLSQVRQKGFF
jgi:TAK1-binding protein 1